MKFLYMFAPLLLLVPLPVLATQTDAPDCRAPSSQADMNRCAFEDFLIVNGAQAAVLNGLTQRLPAPDRRRLRAAQKAWIAWRTAQCAFETGGSSGGSAHQMALWTCQARLVSERTTALEKLAKCPEGDAPAVSHDSQFGSFQPGWRTSLSKCVDCATDNLCRCSLTGGSAS